MRLTARRIPSNSTTAARRFRISANLRLIPLQPTRSSSTVVPGSACSSALDLVAGCRCCHLSPAPTNLALVRTPPSRVKAAWTTRDGPARTGTLSLKRTVHHTNGPISAQAKCMFFCGDRKEMSILLTGCRHIWPGKVDAISHRCNNTHSQFSLRHQGLRRDIGLPWPVPLSKVMTLRARADFYAILSCHTV